MFGNIFGKHKEETVVEEVIEKEPFEPYFKEEMEKTISTCKEYINENSLVFIMVTDIHYKSARIYQNFDHTIDNMKYFNSQVPSSFILNLGDNTDGNTKVITIENSMYMKNRFKEIGIPYYQTIGNHDTNYQGEGVLSMEQMVQLYIADTDVVSNEKTFGTDYYKDFNSIRFVVLNSDYEKQYNFSEDSLDWLQNVALQTDKTVLLAVHVSCIPHQNWNAGHPVNHEKVEEILRQFVESGHKLIQFSGHSHVDYSYQQPWLAIFSACQKFERPDLNTKEYKKITDFDESGIHSNDRLRDSFEEDCWNVVIVNQNDLHVIRFGAGEDRHYNL